MAVTPTYGLQVRGANAVDEMALKKFDGTVVHAWRNALQFNSNPGGVIHERMMPDGSGKSLQFPIIGIPPEADDHDGDGSDVATNTMTSDEVLITIDKELTQKIHVNYVDWKKAHFDQIAPNLKAIGYSLASQKDKRTAVTGVLAARTAAVSNVHNGGNRVTRSAGGATAFSDIWADNATGATNLRDDFAELKYQMDLDSAPAMRYAFIHPWVEHIMRHDTNIFDANLSDMPIPNDLLRGVVGMIEGFILVRTNHLPSTNVTSGQTKFQGNFSMTQSASEAYGRPLVLVMTSNDDGRAAVGYAKYDDPTLTVDDTIEPMNTRTTALLGTALGGHGALHVFCAGTIEGQGT